MKWYHILVLPRYISELEVQLTLLDGEIQSQHRDNREQQKLLAEAIAELQKSLSLLEGKLTVIEKYFTSNPEKNEIEEGEPESIEVDENYRIPIVDGLKVKFEGEDDIKARRLKLYGQGQSSVQKAVKRRAKS